MKKQIIGLALVLALGCRFVSADCAVAEVGTPNAADASDAVCTELEDKFAEADRDMNVGYLLRENFSPYNSGGSGWEQVNMPGGAGIGTISRRAAGLETYIKKSFVAQKGEITAEFKTILVSSVGNGYIAVMGRKNGREVEAAKLRIEDDTLKYVDGEGRKISLYKITDVGWTGVKIVANAAKGTVTVFVNGVAMPAACDVSLSEDCEELSGLKFGLSASSTGAYRLGTVSVYKGYDVHETLSAAGVASVYDEDYDYNSGASATATVDDHSIQNDNNSSTHLAFDGDDTTYWEHNTDYQISKNVYFIASYGNNVVGIDTIRLKFAGYYKGIINVTYQLPDDSWNGWGNGKYSWVRYETTEENDYELVLTLDVPQSLVTLALGFMVGTDGYDIAEQQIQLASFEAKCRNPVVEETADFPSDWSRSETENASVSTYAFYGASSIAEFNAFRVEDRNPTESLTAEKTFSRKGSVTAEFKAYFEDFADGNRIGLENEAGDFVGISTDAGKFNLCQTVNGRTILEPVVNEKASLDGYLTKLWYTFAIKYDGENNSVLLDFNGWSPIGKKTLDSAFSGKTWTKFKAVSASGETVFLFDNVKVWETQPESDVPALEKCDTGDTVLTMQACSLWREGTHIGWGALDNEEMYYRQPVLGWYDEGTPEVSDWEIKMAVDHGISNFMYCWYRYGSEGPIAGSNYGDAIWDGLFKSKYRDDMNFTIMFENSSGLYSYNDLVENLMPYWIEVFFKNPNYQKTGDGKPIFYIYSYSNFMSVIGDVNGDGRTDSADVRAATDKMREMCEDAGLPGLYLAAEDRANSSSTVRAIENCGFDSLFAYTFSTGTYNISGDETLASAQNILLSQRAAIQSPSTFSVIPNISKSWDTRGWTNYGFGSVSAPYMYDLEHYRQFALWVKNVYGGAVIDGQGTKMVMLDNWNEYSEGHWLMPTYGTPAYKGGRYAYGYLDVLREVFSIGAYEHTDYLPLEDGFGPYDAWYPMGWEENVNLYGTAEDGSVRDENTVDWEIGYDTMGGETVYVKAADLSDGALALNAEKANRVVIGSKAVAALKETNAEFSVQMLYGTIRLTREQIASLDENKSLEIVLNVEIDLTEVAVAVRKAARGAYSLCDGEVFTFSLKQGGYDLTNYSVEVELNEVSSRAKGYALYKNGVLEKSEELSASLSVTLNENSRIVILK